MRSPQLITDHSAAIRAFESAPLVRALYAFNRLATRAYHHVDLLTPCPIPRDGPAILICNHTAGLDPMLLQATCPRIITWMMAKEYYEMPVVSWFSKRMQYIPVARGTRDTASLKAALRALDAGKVLGIFPEGKISETGRLLPFQPGVAVIAARSEAPVYPAFISGLQRDMSIGRALIDPQHARLIYGTAIVPNPGDKLTADRLHDAVRRLGERTIAARLHPAS